MTRTERLLLLVGQMNYTWSNTESLLIYLIVDLMGIEKESAIIVFLTLNTTRARLDLIERLAKRGSTPPDTRMEALDIVAAMKREAKVRNKYTHCVYSFGEDGEVESTQLLRISDFGEDVRYGKMEELGDAEVAHLQSTIATVLGVNKAILAYISKRGIEL
jgi:hypothetical protein